MESLDRLRNKKIFLTGHTGFKGGWLALWLIKLGARVAGYSLAPNTRPNLFSCLGLENKIEKSIIGDINNYNMLSKEISDFKPDAIIHMAAQPLVIDSYIDPLNTLQTNILGTANILDISRNIDSLEALLIITTDKCYENLDTDISYKEDDRLGGKDPYSASKSCAELVTSSFRSSFLDELGVNVATARAGNVIGGGDWAQNRLIPDLIRSVEQDEHLKIRYPKATRPWQHVLEPLGGYLLLLINLLSEKGNEYRGAWNFGPSQDKKSVEWVVNYLSTQKEFNFSFSKDQHFAESNLLSLDSTKSKVRLNWKSMWEIEETLSNTVKWYEAFNDRQNMLLFSEDQIDSYYSTWTIKEN